MSHASRRLQEFLLGLLSGLFFWGPSEKQMSDHFLNEGKVRGTKRKKSKYHMPR